MNWTRNEIGESVLKLKDKTICGIYRNFKSKKYTATVFCFEKLMTFNLDEIYIDSAEIAAEQLVMVLCQETIN